MNIEFMMEQAQEALADLKSMTGESIEGVSTMNSIMQDIDMYSFRKEVTILKNNRFELLIKRDEVEFSTTYSNQEITPEYMNEMMLINQNKDKVASYILSLIKMKQEA